MTAGTKTGEQVPPFRFLLPAGWEEVPADRAGVDLLIQRTSQKFRAQQRPDLDAEMRTLLERAYRAMQRGKVFALYLQTSADTMPLPMSITASTLADEFGGTLDRQVAGLFRDRDAQFLRDDHLIVRWETPARVAVDVGRAAVHAIDYLIPVPGSARRRALQLTTVIPVPDDDEQTRAVVEALVELSDTMISTFTWEPADA